MDPQTLAKYMADIGGDTMPPGLQNAVRKVLRGLTGAPTFNLLSLPVSRDLTFTSGGRPSAQLKADVPFLVWGLMGAFWSDDPDDHAGLVKLKMFVQGGITVMGDSQQGANFQTLCDRVDAYPLYPPLLVLPNQPLTIEGVCGTMDGTVMGGTITFCGIQFNGLSIL